MPRLRESGGVILSHGEATAKPVLPPRELVIFAAACPCGQDAKWTAQAVLSSPWPHVGLPTLVTKNDIDCEHCGT